MAQGGVDFYQVIGVEHDASAEEINKKFKVKMRGIHPDKNIHYQEEATRQAQLLNQAKVALLNSELRNKHDQYLFRTGVVRKDAQPLPPSHQPSKSTRSLFQRWAKTPTITKVLTEAEIRPKINNGIAEFLTEAYHQKVMNTRPMKGLNPATTAVSPLDDFFSAITETLFVTETLPQAKKAAHLLLSTWTRSGSSFEAEPKQVPIFDLNALKTWELKEIASCFNLDVKSSQRSQIISEILMYLPNISVNKFTIQTEPKAPQCAFCESAFSLTKWRKYCSGCGRCICYDCCHDTNIRLLYRGATSTDVVCRPCHETLLTDTLEAIAKKSFDLAGEPKLAAVLMFVAHHVSPDDMDVVLCQADLYLITGMNEELMALTRKYLLDPETPQLHQEYLAQSLLALLKASCELMGHPGIKCGMFIAMRQLADKYLSHDDYESERGNYLRMEREGKTELDDYIKKRVAALLNRIHAAVVKGNMEEVESMLSMEYDNETDALMTETLRLYLEADKPAPSDHSYLDLFVRGVAKIRVHGDILGGISAASRGYWEATKVVHRDSVNSLMEQWISGVLTELLRSDHRLPIQCLGDQWDQVHPSYFLIQRDRMVPPTQLIWVKLDEQEKNGLYEEVLHGRYVDHDVRMFIKYEAAVVKKVLNGSWAPIDAGMAYIDLITACSTSVQFMQCFLIAGLWFLKEFLQCSDPEKKVALKQLIDHCMVPLLKMCSNFHAHPFIRFYYARWVYSVEIAFLEENFMGSEDVEIAVKALKMSMLSARFCPLTSLPDVTVAEVAALDVWTRDLHCRYLLGLQTVPPGQRPVTEAALRYQIFENSLRRNCQLVDPDSARLAAMDHLLKEENISWNLVESTMQSPLIALDSDGFYTRKPSLLGPVSSDSITAFHGFEVDLESGKFKLYLKKRPWFFPKEESLLCWQDVALALFHTSRVAVFSLDPVDPLDMDLHPFNAIRIKPNELFQTTLFLHTMLHTDHLLKQMTTGVEVSYRAPFQQRPCSTAGIYKDVPAEIVAKLSMLANEGRGNFKRHRFWIQVDSIETDEKQNSTAYKLLLGGVKMSIRCMPVLITTEGELRDSTDPSDPDSAESKFATWMTENYDLVGSYFPEFLRLRELAKLLHLGPVFQQVVRGVNEMHRKVGGEEETKKFLAKCGHLRELVLKAKDAIGVELEGSDWIPTKVKRANAAPTLWAPAAYGAAERDGRITLVHGGVLLQPGAPTPSPGISEKYRPSACALTSRMIGGGGGKKRQETFVPVYAKEAQPIGGSSPSPIPSRCSVKVGEAGRRRVENFQTLQRGIGAEISTACRSKKAAPDRSDNDSGRGLSSGSGGSSSSSSSDVRVGGNGASRSRSESPAVQEEEVSKSAANKSPGSRGPIQRKLDDCQAALKEYRKILIWEDGLGTAEIELKGVVVAMRPRSGDSTRSHRVIYHMRKVFEALNGVENLVALLNRLLRSAQMASMERNGGIPGLDFAAEVRRGIRGVGKDEIGRIFPALAPILGRMLAEAEELRVVGDPTRRKLLESRSLWDVTGEDAAGRRGVEGFVGGKSRRGVLPGAAEALAPTRKASRFVPRIAETVPLKIILRYKEMAQSPRGEDQGTGSSSTTRGVGVRRYVGLLRWFLSYPDLVGFYDKKVEEFARNQLKTWRHVQPPAEMIRRPSMTEPEEDDFLDEMLKTAGRRGEPSSVSADSKAGSPGDRTK